MNSAAPKSILALLLPLLLSIPPAAAADVRGKVVSVHDGDTITVLIDRRQVKVRLTDIDAPELGQPFGTRSRQSLSEMCFGKEAALAVRGQDRFRRTLAQVSCAGTNVNAEQVRRGYAWTFVRYTGPNSPLYVLEDEARMNRRGLWADPASVPPWEWRRNGRQRVAERMKDEGGRMRVEGRSRDPLAGCDPRRRACWPMSWNRSFAEISEATFTLRVIVEMTRPFTAVQPEDYLRPEVTRGRDI